jgi:uncharacterized OB-fold protein
MSQARSKPIPRPSALSRPFWEGARQGKLMLQQCGRCGAYRWTPQQLCIACHAEEYEWVQVSGRGTLYSFSTVERPPLPAFEPGYVVAVVELAEGPLMLTNLVGCEPAELRIGMPVEVAFEKASEEIYLYKFRRAA